MPSDARLQSALAALHNPIATYRSTIAAARERVRALLAIDDGADRARRELGSFGGGRIDAARFAQLQVGGVIDPLSRQRLQRAETVLAELEAAGEALFTADVPSGDSLRVVVERALARAGRAFGAANVVELIRSGRYEPERHDRLLDSFPFQWWTKTERAHAPPLVTTVSGADLHAGSLAELLDVGTRLVLLVRGPSTPAPLVRLITPGGLVMQTRELAALGRVAELEGPAIAAIVEEEAAIFTHDSGAGSASWQRLTISQRPTGIQKSLAGLSVRQQREELAQLEALAERPALPAAPVEALVPRGNGDPAERLTAWLLAESGYTDAV